LLGGPEKAGAGGSIPSLATIPSTTYRPVSPRFHSNSFQIGTTGCAPPGSADWQFIYIRNPYPLRKACLFLQSSFAVSRPQDDKPSIDP
jgi:hypothetical protein